jgi:hypothetical protein
LVGGLKFILKLRKDFRFVVRHYFMRNFAVIRDIERLYNRK